MRFGSRTVELGAVCIGLRLQKCSNVYGHLRYTPVVAGQASCDIFPHSHLSAGKRAVVSSEVRRKRHEDEKSLRINCLQFSVRPVSGIR